MLNRKTKWTLLILVLLIPALFLVGCGGNQADGNKTITIGVAAPDFNDQWLSYLYDGIRSYAKNHENVEVKLVDAKNSPVKQLSQVENFITQQVDGILLIPTDTESMGPIVKTAKEANIPMVAVNRMFDEVDQIASYVGSNSIKAGKMQMKYMAEKVLNGKGNIAIMKGQLGQEAQIKRTEGNLQVINNYPDMKVVLEGTAKWQRSKAMTLMENWLQSGVKIDAVVANNDEMAIGAIKALKAAGKLDEIAVAGVDATPIALEYMDKGELDVTVFQNAMGQGSKGVETLVRVIKGEDVKDRVWVPYELVTPKNYKEYVAKWEK